MASMLGSGTLVAVDATEAGPGAGATTGFALNLATTTNNTTLNPGGLATGERPSTSPSVAGDIVFYTTTTESAAAPCSDFSAKLYAVTYAGGAAYDSNDNGKIDSNENRAALTFAGRATAPLHAVMAGSDWG